MAEIIKKNTELSPAIADLFTRPEGMINTVFQFKGEGIDLSTISKADAERIVAAGFPFLTPIKKTSKKE